MAVLQEGHDGANRSDIFSISPGTCLSQVIFSQRIHAEDCKHGPRYTAFYISIRGIRLKCRTIIVRILLDGSGTRLPIRQYLETNRIEKTFLQTLSKQD
jgi:hypothetical protein